MAPSAPILISSLLSPQIPPFHNLFTQAVRDDCGAAQPSLCGARCDAHVKAGASLQVLTLELRARRLVSVEFEGDK